MPSMFGAPLLHGRFWTAQEEHSRAPVLVIDRDTSVELFGTGNGVGRELRLGGTVFRVIGISNDWAPQPRFLFLYADSPAWGGSRAQSAFIPGQEGSRVGKAGVNTGR